MSHLRTAILAMSAGLLFLGSPPAATSQDRGGMQQSGGQITWHTDKRKAWDEARRTGKPIWALFR